MPKAAGIKNHNSEVAMPGPVAKLFRIATSQMIDGVADSCSPVLIFGEPGSGKRTLAKQIHQASPHSGDGFFEIDCRTISVDELAETVDTRGTIYLSEVGDLSPAAQTFLMESHFPRNGNRPAFRILAAASRSLSEEVRQRHMREEFFYAIAPVIIQTVPLRFRKNEIVEIASSFLEEYAPMFGRPKPVLSPGMISFMRDYAWPGNLRELDTVAKMLAAFADESIIIAALHASASKLKAVNDHTKISLKQVSRAASLQAEREMISQVLTSTGWNRKQAARELRISYKALLYKIKQSGLENVPACSDEGQVQ